MKSSSTNKNTIQFKSKKEEFENLHKNGNHTKDSLHFYKAHDNSHKVLKYPNKREKGIKKINKLKEYLKRNKYIKFIFIGIVILSLIFLYDKVILNNDNTSSSSKTFISEDTNISSSKSSTYSSIIQETVKKYTGVNSEVITENIHKNGNSIYANGYFNHPSEGKIYFDIKLQNDNPSSLVINGEEYID